jgi:hypothetical protein
MVKRSVYTHNVGVINIINFITYPKNDSNIPIKRENKFRKTFEKMEGFNFGTPVTYLNRPNTGEDDDDDDDDDDVFALCMTFMS